MMRYLALLMLSCYMNVTWADSLDNLSNLLKPYRAFSADFKQTTLNQGGEAISQMTGELAIAGEAMFYWRTNSPFAQVIVADGDELWVFDEDLYQVQVRPIDEELRSSPAAILSGKVETLDLLFTIKEDQDGDIAVYRLEPKAMDEVTKQIVLSFDGSHLVDLTIKDALGNQSLVTLMKVNLGQPESNIFQFTPPEGADIIYAIGKEP